MPLYNIALEVAQDDGHSPLITDTIMLAAAAPTGEQAAEQVQVIIEGLSLVHETRVVNVHPAVNAMDPDSHDLSDLNDLSTPEDNGNS
jgi:hypothetical protein